MTVQISQRGKQYLKTAQSLLRVAQTMTDRAIAGQLKALADDYQQRAEKASHVDAAKALARSAANAEGEGSLSVGIHGEADTRGRNDLPLLKVERKTAVSL
jgi:hypothetical protein